MVYVKSENTWYKTTFGCINDMRIASFDRFDLMVDEDKNQMVRPYKNNSELCYESVMLDLWMNKSNATYLDENI